MRIIAADQPVEPVLEGRALQAQLLREGLELAIGVGIAIEQVGRRIIIVAIIGRLVVAIGCDAGQLRAAQIIVDLAGDAPVLELAGIVAARRDADLPPIGVLRIGRRAIGETRAQRGKQRDDAVGRAGGETARARAGFLADIDIDGGAAALVMIGIVGDQADGEIVVRLEEDLAAQEIAIAVVGVADRAAGRVDQRQEAVALRPDAFEARGDRAADRAGDAGGGMPVIIIAVGQLAGRAEIEAGRLGDDVDEAGRRVAAKQGALRPAQHFDALDLAQIGEGRAGARAIDAVDEHRDRAFQARIVADRADAADARDAVCLGAGRDDEQRRRELVEAGGCRWRRCSARPAR